MNSEETRGTAEEEVLQKILAVVVDLSARVVALENLSLHIFADEIFSKSRPLAQIDGLRTRLVKESGANQKSDSQEVVDLHYDRLIALLEGVALREKREVQN